MFSTGADGTAEAIAAGAAEGTTGADWPGHAPIVNDPPQLCKQRRQSLHLIKHGQMPDLGLEERFRIFQFAAVTYAFQIQINCALYSIRKLSGERSLANLACAN